MKCFNLLAVAGITNRVLLVGHSYGGLIALLAAIKHPDKIAGALLIGGDVSPKLEKMLWISEKAKGRNDRNSARFRLFSSLIGQARLLLSCRSLGQIPP